MNLPGEFNPKVHNSPVQMPPGSEEDTHLAELVRSLRSLAGESPERQAKIEGLMRAYATGTLQVNAEATADAIIDQATASHSRLR